MNKDDHGLTVEKERQISILEPNYFQKEKPIQHLAIQQPDYAIVFFEKIKLVKEREDRE